MCKKIVVSLLSISLMTALMMVTVNPSSVMAIVGLQSFDAKSLDKVQAETVNSLSTVMNDLAQKMGKETEKNYASEDGAVEINAVKTSKDVSIVIDVDASKIETFNYKDIGKVVKVAQGYMKPVFSEKQTMGLCGLLLGDAYAQYRKGNDKINISKKYEGLTITCSGEVKTGRTTLTLKSTIGVKKCLPNKSKITEMKASRL